MQRAFLTILLIVLIRMNSFAQILDNKPQVDTLSLGQCISFRTNMVDWSMLTPNIGLEINLGNTNWHRWALEFNAKYLWKGHHALTPPAFYHWTDLRAEVRNYWRTRNMSDPVNRMLPMHKGFWQHLLSHRRRVAKHPKTVYYRGFYAGYTNFGFYVPHTGRQGEVMHAGMTVGMVRPMYTYKNGFSIDLELGASIGAGVIKMDKFWHNSVEDSYEVTERADGWKLIPFPLITDIHAGIIYRLNKYPLEKRYKWRYEVDLKYQAMMDSINQMLAKQRFEKHYRDSVYKMIYKDYKHIYDSLAKKNKLRQDSIDKIKKHQQDSINAVVRAEKEKAKQAAKLALLAQKDSIAKAKAALKDSLEKAAAKEKAFRDSIERAEKLAVNGVDPETMKDTEGNLYVMDAKGNIYLADSKEGKAAIADNNRRKAAASKSATPTAAGGNGKTPAAAAKKVDMKNLTDKEKQALAEQAEKEKVAKAEAEEKSKKEKAKKEKEERKAQKEALKKQKAAEKEAAKKKEADLKKAAESKKAEDSKKSSADEKTTNEKKEANNEKAN